MIVKMGENTEGVVFFIKIAFKKVIYNECQTSLQHLVRAI
jgi:hypothetical protein